MARTNGLGKSAPNYKVVTKAASGGAPQLRNKYFRSRSTLNRPEYAAFMQPITAFWSWPGPLPSFREVTLTRLLEIEQAAFSPLNKGRRIAERDISGARAKALQLLDGRGRHDYGDLLLSVARAHYLAEDFERAEAVLAVMQEAERNSWHVATDAAVARGALGRVAVAASELRAAQDLLFVTTYVAAGGKVNETEAQPETVELLLGKVELAELERGRTPVSNRVLHDQAGKRGFLVDSIDYWEVGLFHARYLLEQMATRDGEINGGEILGVMRTAYADSGRFVQGEGRGFYQYITREMARVLLDNDVPLREVVFAFAASIPTDSEIRMGEQREAVPTRLAVLADVLREREVPLQEVHRVLGEVERELSDPGLARRGLCLAVAQDRTNPVMADWVEVDMFEVEARVRELPSTASPEQIAAAMRPVVERSASYSEDLDAGNVYGHGIRRLTRRLLEQKVPVDVVIRAFSVEVEGEERATVLNKIGEGPSKLVIALAEIAIMREPDVVLAATVAVGAEDSNLGHAARAFYALILVDLVIRNDGPAGRSDASKFVSG
ncbi:MAG: hypothetical protein ABIH76_02670, partial [Candidatus Bathyarchaeota archaeon]